MTVGQGRYRTCRRQSPSVRRDARRGDPYGDAARARIRFDHIVDGCVLGIPGSFTNVVEALGIRHQHSPWGVRPSVSRRWLQSSLLANPSKESSSVIEDLQRGSPYHSGCRPRCSTYWDCVKSVTSESGTRSKSATLKQCLNSRQRDVPRGRASSTSRGHQGYTARTAAMGLRDDRVRRGSASGREGVDDEPTAVAGVVIAFVGIQFRLDRTVDTDGVSDPLVFRPRYAPRHSRYRAGRHRTHTL